MTLKTLSEVIGDQKHKNIPVHARPKTVFSEKDSNELTKSIVAFMRYKGHFARRLSSEGRYRPGDEVTNAIGKRVQMKGTWIPGMNTGMSDVIGILKPSGKFIGIEVKYGKDRQGDDQKEFQADVEAAGGIYILAKTWDGFILEISKYI